jgi:glucan phosphoethanolaminetransferase (alkaline phosphatase superfamily)
LSTNNHPYKTLIFNELEQREITASIITLYGGMLFLSEDSDTKGFSIFVFIIIVYLNFRFIILWFYSIIKHFSKKFVLAKTINIYLSKWIKYGMHDISILKSQSQNSFQNKTKEYKKVIKYMNPLFREFKKRKFKRNRKKMENLVKHEIPKEENKHHEGVKRRRRKKKVRKKVSYTRCKLARKEEKVGGWGIFCRRVLR